MRKEGGGTRADVRSSALWGSGSRGGDSRSNALWGKSGRGIAVLAALVTMLVVPVTGGAAIGDCGSGQLAMVPKSLSAEACANRGKVFDVVVQGRLGKSSDLVA